MKLYGKHKIDKINKETTIELYGKSASRLGFSDNLLIALEPTII